MSQLDTIQATLDALTTEARSLRRQVEVQTTRIAEQTQELAEQTHEIARRTRALWAALIVGGLVLAGLIFVSLDNHRTIDANNRRWCPMVGLLIPKPGDAPPSTERGREVVVSALQLWQDFDCDAAVSPS